MLLGFKEKDKGGFEPVGLDPGFHIDQADLQQKFNAYSSDPIALEYREFERAIAGTALKFASSFTRFGPFQVFPRLLDFTITMSESSDPAGFVAATTKTFPSGPTRTTGNIEDHARNWVGGSVNASSPRVAETTGEPKILPPLSERATMIRKPPTPPIPGPQPSSPES